jgi:hypothetical protein
VVLSFPLAFGLACAAIAATVIVASRMAKKQSEIMVSRSQGLPRSNPEGMSIFRNICPICHEENFFSGEAENIIYCGNAKCRAGFKVYNYDGKDMIWADAHEKGPDHLYY